MTTRPHVYTQTKLLSSHHQHIDCLMWLKHASVQQDFKPKHNTFTVKLHTRKYDCRQKECHLTLQSDDSTASSTEFVHLDDAHVSFHRDKSPSKDKPFSNGFSYPGRENLPEDAQGHGEGENGEPVAVGGAHGEWGEEEAEEEVHDGRNLHLMEESDDSGE